MARRFVGPCGTVLSSSRDGERGVFLLGLVGVGRGAGPRVTVHPARPGPQPTLPRCSKLRAARIGVLWGDIIEFVRLSWRG